MANAKVNVPAAPFSLVAQGRAGLEVLELRLVQYLQPPIPLFPILTALP